MKTKILNRINILLGALLTMLGMGGCMRVKYGPEPMYGVPVEKYGVPTAEFHVQGKVVDEADEPLQNITIRIEPKTTGERFSAVTNEEGKYSIVQNAFPADSVKVVAEDLRLDAYKADSVMVAVQYDRTNADEWFEGEASAEVNFQLKKTK